MTDRPIIFSAPMVRALIEGRKTQTRRVLKPQPSAGVRYSPFVQTGLEDGHGREIKPRFLPGDRLWVREAHYLTDDGESEFAVYAADEDAVRRHSADVEKMLKDVRLSDVVAHHAKKRPSIHMPRWASRITLTVADVRVQRVGDIGEADCFAEGVAPFPDWKPAPFKQFRELWDKLHGPGSFEANPWVAAVSFTVDLRNIDAPNPEEPHVRHD